MTRLRPTLAQTFFAANLCLAALLGALVYGLARGSEQSLLRASEAVRTASARLISQRIRAYFGEAERLAASLERRVHLGLADAQDPRSMEAALFAAAADHPGLAGASFTTGRAEGWGDDGRLVLAPDGRWQVSVFREGTEAGGALHTSRVRRSKGAFVREVSRRAPGAGLHETEPTRVDPEAPPDPTEHPTFVTPASRPHASRGLTLWSDLSFLEADAHLPESKRRVVVTALRTVHDRSGGLAGVVRLGLRAETIDRIVHEEQERVRPHRILLADQEGRLVSRLSPEDAVREESDGALRVAPSRLPEEVRRALLDAGHRFRVAGRSYLASRSELPGTQGWRVLVLVAEDDLPGVAEQTRLRRRLVAFAVFVSLAILLGGFFTLRTVRRGLEGISSVSTRMRQFDFAADSPRAFFRDILEVREGLELAKTAMRALGKYVPVDLVRILYRTGREPVLGGEPATVTLLFSDIKGFTSLAERLPANELALLLGRYFEVMAGVLQGCGGTIDKYIGDAIMAMWNAPVPVADHARRACEAALRAQAAADVLYASPEWAGRPPLVTRFGLHTGEVLVGHFGAPDRLSYTCLGDGVNLASRLEGLNKQYGTTLLVSDALREAAGAGFVFRFLDKVAVSGKGQSVGVHELLGREGLSGPRLDRARRYEAALALYLRRDFAGALRDLEPLAAEDPPAAVLAERCRRLLADPPPPDWDGVYVSSVK